MERDNEKLNLQIKDLNWQLNQFKDTQADRKRQAEQELNEARGQAMATTEAKIQEFEE